MMLGLLRSLVRSVLGEPRRQAHDLFVRPSPELRVILRDPIKTRLLYQAYKARLDREYGRQNRPRPSSGPEGEG